MVYQAMIMVHYITRGSQRRWSSIMKSLTNTTLPTSCPRVAKKKTTQIIARPTSSGIKLVHALLNSEIVLMKMMKVRLTNRSIRPKCH